MLSLLPRRIRTFRRLIMVLFFLAFAFTFTEHLRDAAKLRAVSEIGRSNSGSRGGRWSMISKLSSSRVPAQAQQQPAHVQQHLVTVTEYRTVWKQPPTPRATSKNEPRDNANAVGGADADSLPPGEQQHANKNSPTPNSEPLLQQHIYRSDGLLEVNPEGPHPIFELIRKSEADWEAKLARASKTLHDAVIEYENRYKRSPPTGFDKWWDYVQKHNVQLPDEYDQIYHDLEPFWGINPTDLQSIVTEWEFHDDTYTIGKDAPDAPIMLVNFSLPGQDKAEFNLAGGAYEIMELLEDVEEWIPPFRAVISPHDNPNLSVDWELRRMAVRHAELGTFMDVNNPPPAKLDGWLSSCDPTSHAWHTPIDWTKRPPPPSTTTPKTFIHNHPTTMDPCHHPSLFLLHGQFLSHNKGPTPHRRLVPQFSYSPTKVHGDVMLAMPINWVEDLWGTGNEVINGGDNPEWEGRWEERVVWRGTNTGMWHAPETRWRDAQRSRLAELFAASGGSGSGSGSGGDGKKTNPNINATAKVLPPRKDETEKVGEGVEMKRARLNPALLDIALAGDPGSCKKETCEELKEVFEFGKPMSLKKAGRYKYVLDVDGNGWSSRFKRLITSYALVFKSTVYPEWFADRIAPWVHYIPVQVDYSDLYDSVLFFHGDLYGEGGHDDLARKIGLAGREWSLKFWRKEDLTAYMFRLFLEYSRVMSTDRLSMNYVPPES